MTWIKYRRPSPATIVAVVALVAALGGSAVAQVATTTKLSKKERKQTKKIATKQVNKVLPIENENLADGAVTSPKIGDGAVTSAKILDGTVVGGDIGTIVYRRAKGAAIVGDGATGSISVRCQAGERALWGGGRNDETSTKATILSIRPIRPGSDIAPANGGVGDGFRVTVANTGNQVNVRPEVWVACIS